MNDLERDTVMIFASFIVLGTIAWAVGFKLIDAYDIEPWIMAVYNLIFVVTGMLATLLATCVYRLTKNVKDSGGTTERKTGGLS